ncbi:DUF2637 domain-containing protein [Rhodococcus sp. PD04]|uniref:DUF2637 domain-containing protein n=1 Tax=Rhodococcus sp. PD04 TaxID=3109594 RepID=UPI002DD90A57|nr:DUF2637 domain-containing protein [Rhodococcus sp. PD04]WSE22312.1 DUF2637 domain-containing protein [Rhodococcus sp. PD04]
MNSFARLRSVSLAVVAAAIAALAVAGASFFRSFTALSELAVAYHFPTEQAWTLPIALDGLAIAATASAAVAKTRRGRGYAWFLLVAGTVASVVANGIHAYELTASPVGVGIAVVLPLVTLAATHLAIELARQHRDDETEPGTDRDRDAAPVDDETELETTPAPVALLRVAPDPEPVAEASVAPKATPVARKPRRIATAGDGDELRDRALRLVADGVTYRDAGAKLGVSKDRVYRWVKEQRATEAPVAAAS